MGNIHMGFHWGKIEASGLICNLNLPIMKLQFRFHNITNASAPKFLEEKIKTNQNKSLNPSFENPNLLNMIT